MTSKFFFVIQFLCVARGWCGILPLSDSLNLDDPNSIYNYMSEESVARLEEQFGLETRISFDVRKVFFKLWTREAGLSNPFQFNHETASEELLNNHFNPKRPTKILAHGFFDSSSWAEPFAKAYIENLEFDVNIIGVDWGKLSSHNGLPHYFIAANNAIKVGKHAGSLFTKMLIEDLGVNPKNIHAIGHSLGAHVVGHFGRTIQAEVNEKISRITALDPAAPWFAQTKEEHRMNRDDADSVDVIHTNSGLLIQGGLSFLQRLGDVDFYPNGGKHQPGCTELCIGDFCIPGNNHGISIIDWMQGGCSHGRSHEYYVESIQMTRRSFAYLSEFCQTWKDYITGSCVATSDDFIQMGENCHLLSSKKYSPPAIESGGLLPGFFLETNKKPPFSKTR